MRHLAAIISTPKVRELHDHFPRRDRALETELNNITLGLNQLKVALVADHSYDQMSESLDVILAVQVISSLQYNTSKHIFTVETTGKQLCTDKKQVNSFEQ